MNLIMIIFTNKLVKQTWIYRTVANTPLMHYHLCCWFPFN